MPRTTSNPCPCGCGQPATTVKSSPQGRRKVQGSRTRVAKCNACGSTIRVARSDFAAGLHGCRCLAGVLEPVCLQDRCELPGEAGELAWREWAARDAIRGQLSEWGRKGGVRRGQAMSAAAKVRRANREAGREPMPF